MIRNLQELWQYRALLWNLTQRELKARYRGSALGFLWTFVNPLLLMAVYALVFGVIQKSNIPHYTYFVFVGLLPWIWFSTSVGAGASTISDRRDLLTKVRFPAQVLPATVVGTNLVNFLLSLPLMVAMGALFGVWPSVHALAFPLVLFRKDLLTWLRTMASLMAVQTSSANSSRRSSKTWAASASSSSEASVTKVRPRQCGHRCS